MRVGDPEGLEGRAAVLSVQVVFGKGWTDVLMPVNPLTADFLRLLTSHVPTDTDDANGADDAVNSMDSPPPT
ncbi:uncharacterized protein LAESUDRAFT_763803 [Laetiporus sulphureus 93-53]|uniref:Uncharacterized protein n=1 Tax=Laetiporus sulphureus 93-53 TaxID=1314785 RepID=A0A165BPL4_9APHY|nr:uncharacterized protein LAESUDRAFT_763803 [Laetiporus sulphureus 93-53]KZT01426.1 hypothetical protein LAESUDRAFT_763803 [Laetiporus sulphureus 93-53]